MDDKISDYKWAAQRLRGQINRCANNMLKVVDCIEKGVDEEGEPESVSDKDIRDLGELVTDISESMESLLQMTILLKGSAEKLKKETNIIH